MLKVFRFQRCSGSGLKFYQYFVQFRNISLESMVCCATYQMQNCVFCNAWHCVSFSPFGEVVEFWITRGSDLFQKIKTSFYFRDLGLSTFGICLNPRARMKSKRAGSLS